MKIIDYLIQKGDNEDGVAFPICASFTVDNTVLSGYVTASYDAGHLYHDHYLKDAADKAIFADYDNFILLNVGIVLPLAFEFFSPSVKLGLKTSDDEGNDIALPGLGGNDSFIVPFVNFEIPLDLMYRPMDLHMTGSRLGGKIFEEDGTDVKISMINVPDSLNGLVFEIPLFAKILHNVKLG